MVWVGWVAESINDLIVFSKSSKLERGKQDVTAVLVELNVERYRHSQLLLLLQCCFDQMLLCQISIRPRRAGSSHPRQLHAP